MLRMYANSRSTLSTTLTSTFADNISNGPTQHTSSQFHFHSNELCQYCRNECRHRPLRWSSLGPTQADRSLGQPRRRFLHSLFVYSRYAWHEHLCQLAKCREHSARTDHLRTPWRLGSLSMGNTREVRRKSGHNFPRRRPHPLLRSATDFLSFMGGYTVFLGPITGIMITDVSLRYPFILAGGKRIRIVLRLRCASVPYDVRRTGAPPPP
jgi:hypothetical protein